MSYSPTICILNEDDTMSFRLLDDFVADNAQFLDYDVTLKSNVSTSVNAGVESEERIYNVVKNLETAEKTE